MKSLPKKTQQQQQQPQKKASEQLPVMPLKAINYMMLAFGALVIAGTYLGMYLEREVDGIFALYISPVLLIGSYLWIVFAILYRPKSHKKQPA